MISTCGRRAPIPAAARASGFDPRFDLEVGAAVDDFGRLYHAGTRLPGAVANCYEQDRLCVLPVSALWNAPARLANTSPFVASGGNANPESERNSLDLRSRVSGSLTVSLLGCLSSLGRDTEKIEEIISAKPDAS